MDRILLEGMAFNGRHGVLPAERELGARFSVDVELEAELSRAAATDHLEDTVDYAAAYQAIREVVEGEPCNLLETVAERVATRLLSFDGVRRARVRISKTPPLPGEFRAFAVEVTRP